MIANLENRRAAFTRSALARLGYPPALELSWEAVLQDPKHLSSLLACDRVRVDSFGEDAGVHDALVIRGGAPPGTQLEHGALAYLEEAYQGWLSLLCDLDGLGLPSRTWLSRPQDIACMFDKWATHLRLSAAGVSRPATWQLPRNWTSFQATLPDRGRWFLKPRYGSSGSGVCAFRWAGPRMQLIAPIELVREEQGVRLFNSLRIRRFGRPEDIRAILDILLASGMIGETWLPKARLGDREFDLRILVVAGRARHCVVRTSLNPMTNLHLGNQRADPDELVEGYGADALARCQELSEGAMAVFPDTLFGGVDVLLGREGRPYVLEINAFGDLLPGILHRGEDTATAILRAAAGEPS